MFAFKVQSIYQIIFQKLLLNITKSYETEMLIDCHQKVLYIIVPSSVYYKTFPCLYMLLNLRILVHSSVPNLFRRLLLYADTQKLFLLGFQFGMSFSHWASARLLNI